MDKIKSFYHFVILSLFFLQIQSCTSDITISLGNGYFYRDEGDNLKDILCKNVNGVEVPATVINYVYDSKFILAKQLPKYPQDPLYNKEYEYKKGSDAVYFWIIDKSNNVQYGPLEKREYDKLRQKLRIPRNLQLEATLCICRGDTPFCNWNWVRELKNNFLASVMWTLHVRCILTIILMEMAESLR